METCLMIGVLLYCSNQPVQLYPQRTAPTEQVPSTSHLPYSYEEHKARMKEYEIRCAKYRGTPVWRECATPWSTVR